MKWGKRRAVGSDGLVTKNKSRARKEIDSAIREVSNVKSIVNSSKMSDSELKTKTDRLRNENALKELTKSPRITRKQKAKRAEYLDRGKLSDKDLQDRVQRLRLEKQLKDQSKSANKTSIKVVNKVVNEVSKVAIKKYTDDKGNFKATNDPILDTLIKVAIDQYKDKKIIK